MQKNIFLLLLQLWSYGQAHIELAPAENSTDFHRIGMCVIHKIKHILHPLCVCLLSILAYFIMLIFSSILPYIDLLSRFSLKISTENVEKSDRFCLGLVWSEAVSHCEGRSWSEFVA